MSYDVQVASTYMHSLEGYKLRELCFKLSGFIEQILSFCQVIGKTSFT